MVHVVEDLTLDENWDVLGGARAPSQSECIEGARQYQQLTSPAGTGRRCQEEMLNLPASIGNPLLKEDE